MTQEERIIELAREIIKLAGQIHILEQNPTMRWHVRSITDHIEQTAYHARKIVEYRKNKEE